MANNQTQTPRARARLSYRLMATIILVILAVEIVIYLPSVANFRENWLQDKLMVGTVATRVLDIVPDSMDLPQGLTDRLLDSAGAAAIAYRRDGKSQLISHSLEAMPMVAVTADLREDSPPTLIAGALDTLFFGSERTMRIVGDAPGAEDAVIDVLTSEAPLRDELLVYSRNIFLLSLLIASMTALVIFFFVDRAMLRPIERLVQNMMAYRREPENAALIIKPGKRRDEIGIAEQELAEMQTELYSILRQRRHLSDLGLAVAKINHDLRNTLTAAQLLSDQVATLDDPKVQRLAPRLVNTLGRAIGFAQAVIDYGRESASPPKPQPVDLRALLDECALEAGLGGHPLICVQNEVADDTILKLDPDQIARVFVNLMKNAREALEGVGGTTEDGYAIRFGFEVTQSALLVSVCDNGPGLPPRARDNLFIAFEGSARSGGTGLGLAIAQEITQAHGGHLSYEPLDPGTKFSVHLPLDAQL